MADAPTRIAIVTPHPWNVPHPVNDHVAELADGIRALRRLDPDAPDVVVLAPSGDARSRRRTRRALRDLALGAPAARVLSAPELDAPAPGARSGDPEHDWPLLAVAPALVPASVAVRSSLTLVLERAEVDVLVVQDALEADLTRLAARRWSGLTIGVFHDAPSPGVLSLLPAAHRDGILDAIDRWAVPAEDDQVASRVAAALDVTVEDFATLPTIAAPAPTTDISAATPAPEGVGVIAQSTIVIGREPGDDAAIRLLLRELSGLDADHPRLEVLAMARWGRHHRPTAPRWLRGRLRTQAASTRADAEAALRVARAYVAMPGASMRALAEARACGVAIVALADDAPLEDAVAAVVREVAQVLRSDGARDTPAVAELPGRRHLAEALLGVVEELRARRRLPQVHIPAPALAERTCFIDLHMHTNHSWDCATEPEMLLYAAREIGLTAIAVTDHNELSGALACAGMADEYGIQVVVGEEVMTQDQGEVIGLFLTEKVEPGQSWQETVRLIRAQGGLVYVPHPFDRLHTIPDVSTLRASLEEIDAFETYNSRLTFERYNRDAERFARKYNLIEGSGSDAHVPQGLGTAGVRMPAWDDPESFLTALRQGEIVRRPKSLLYLQGLKRIHQVAGRAGTGLPKQDPE